MANSKMRGLWIVFAIVALIAAFSYNYLRLQEEPKFSALIMSLHSQAEAEFKAWMTEHNKAYSSEDEYFKRFSNFRDNNSLVKVYNSSPIRSKLGLNQYADLSYYEFKSIFKVAPEVEANEVEILDVDNLPESVDWRVKGAVTSPKDQKTCNAGWAFSAAAAVEGARAIAKGKLKPLSEKQLIDCDKANSGCSSGRAVVAFRYVSEFGLELEKTYPNNDQEGKCEYNSERVKARPKGFRVVKPNDQLQLKAAVARQPVVASVQADQAYFMLYSSGVITENCGSDVNHEVLIVGYGTDDHGTPYWLIKNSFGVGWGDGGYSMIYRTDSKSEKGMCGIATHAVYPVYCPLGIIKG